MVYCLVLLMTFKGDRSHQLAGARKEILLFAKEMAIGHHKDLTKKTTLSRVTVARTTGTTTPAPCPCILQASSGMTQLHLAFTLLMSSFLLMLLQMICRALEYIKANCKWIHKCGR